MTIKAVRDWQREGWFDELVAQGNLRKPAHSAQIPRLYVLVRDDILPPVHQGIQAAHAVIRLGSDDPKNLRWINPDSYLILLGASEEEMKRWARKKSPAHATYIDTGLVDLSTGLPVMTAIAFEPMTLEEGNKLFGHLERAQ